MADEAVAQTEETVADTVAQEEAEFVASYEGKVLADDPPVDAAADQSVPEEPVAETPEAPRPEYVQITREDLEELRRGAALAVSLQGELRGARTVADRAYGMVESVHKAMKDTPAQREVVVTDDDFAELGKEYGDVAKMVAAGIRNVVKRIPAGPAIGQPAAVDPNAIREHVRAQQHALELERLNEVYPDWRATVGAQDDPSNRYRAWLQTKPAEYRERMNKTASGEMLKRSLDWYYAEEVRAAMLPAPQPSRPIPPAAAQRPQQQRVLARPSRMRAAVPPNGSAGQQAAPPSELDELLRGFNGP